MKCCICKKEFKGYGNNPIPVKSNGKCCDECNMVFIIPARISIYEKTKNKNFHATHD